VHFEGQIIIVYNFDTIQIFIKILKLFFLLQAEEVVAGGGPVHVSEPDKRVLEIQGEE